MDIEIKTGTLFKWPRSLKEIKDRLNSGVHVVIDPESDQKILPQRELAGEIANVSYAILAALPDPEDIGKIIGIMPVQELMAANQTAIALGRTRASIDFAALSKKSPRRIIIG